MHVCDMVQDMYEDSDTFKVGVRLHHYSPCSVIFADDIVVCTERRELVEESLVTWRYALEMSGLKVSRRKIEYVCVCQGGRWNREDARQVRSGTSAGRVRWRD